ncbi:MAG: hypothetical protein LAQ69_49665 [Acidobacteriia bacterium]|nr:hypothetical protein [Terriglobia bacterium]
MQKIGGRWVLLGAGLALWGAVGLAQTASKPAGHWQGKIQIPDHELGIAVDLAQSPKGAWIGSMSVTGSTSIDVPLAGIAIEGTAVRFAASLPQRASFDGHLSADGSSLSGTASSAAGEAPFQLTRNGEANVSVPPPSSALSKEFEGAWEGTIDADGKVRRVALKLSPAAGGTAMAILIAVDQGNLEIPVSTVTIKDKQLQLEARAVSGTYRGTLGESGDIAGEWSQGPTRVPLTFKRGSSEAKKP